jgi:N-acetyltransferase
MTVLQTVNHALSAPDLTREVLADSKAYLFLLASTSPSSPNTMREREKIVGCVIAQRIETAMKIIPFPSQGVTSNVTSLSPSKLYNQAPEDLTLCDSHNSSRSSAPDPTPITVQFSDDSSDTGLFCSPTALPTPLGIPRLFVSSSHRHKGIASLLLDATARTFIHGCPLRPELGHVAFSQPTRAGRGVMERWGKGGVRIYQE